MPSYEKIESFADSLLNLGRELEYLEESKEPAARVERPLEGINMDVDESTGNKVEISSGEFLRRLEEREKQEESKQTAPPKPPAEQEDDIFGGEEELIDDFLYDAEAPESVSNLTYESSVGDQEGVELPDEGLAEFDAGAEEELSPATDAEIDGEPDAFGAIEGLEELMGGSPTAEADGTEITDELDGAPAVGLEGFAEEELGGPQDLSEEEALAAIFDNSEDAESEGGGGDFDVGEVATEGFDFGEAGTEESQAEDFSALTGDIVTGDENVSDMSPEDIESLQSQLETYDLSDDIIGDVGVEPKEADFGDVSFADGLDVSAEKKPSRPGALEASEADKSAQLSDIQKINQLKISEEDYQKILDTAHALPLNLRKLVFQIIIEPVERPKEVYRLIHSLISGASIRTINRIVNLITGERVVIPWRYEKQWVGDRERQEKLQRTERLSKRSRLVLRITLGIFSIVFTGLVLLTYVYRPIVASTLYNRGYALVSNGEYKAGNELFLRAWGTRAVPKWAMRYADSYIEQKRYDLAVEKYDQLVYGTDEELREILIQKTADKQLYDLYRINKRYSRPIEFINIDRDGIFAHVHLQSEIIGDYERADQLLSLILSEDKFDYEALIASGDNYINWGDRDPQQYEGARQAYTTLLNEYGERDDILMRLLWYFTRTDNRPRAEEISHQFLTSRRKIIPEIYAEYAGYLMERHNDVSTVRDILLRISREESQLPELHYYSAMYNFMINDASTHEKKSLENALALFEGLPELSIRRLKRMLDARIRLGEYYYREQNYLDAEREVQRARQRYEEELDERRLDSDPRIARLYAILGDIRYYDGRRYDDALNQFLTASEHGYVTPQLQYKVGNIYYRSQNYEEAIEYFLDAEKNPGTRQDDELQYAIGNTLFNLGNYNVAESYYRLLLDSVEQKRRNIPVGFTTSAAPHRQIIEYLIRINNNLGVVLNRISERNGGATTNSQAMLHLQRSMEYAEDVRREPVTKVRSDASTLAYLNMRSILYERNNIVPSIYTDIPIDLDTAFAGT